MRNFFIYTLEKILGKLTRDSYVVPLPYHQSPLLLEQSEKDKEIEQRLPLNVGDVVKFESGNEYKVELNSLGLTEHDLRKAQPVRLRRVVKEEDKNKEDKEKYIHYQFGSLRELNYYVLQQRYLIDSIKKIEFAKPRMDKTIDECHVEALKIEERYKKKEEEKEQKIS